MVEIVATTAALRDQLAKRASDASLRAAARAEAGRISDVTGTAALAMGEIAAANLQTVGQADTGAASARELDQRINALQAEAEAFVRRLRAA